MFKHVPFQEGVWAYTQRLQWSNGSGSDLFALLHAYTVWEKYHNEKRFGTGRTKEDSEKMKENETKWANRYFLEVAALYECYTQKQEITKRLERLGISPRTGYNRVIWSNSEKSIILKVVIAGN